MEKKTHSILTESGLNRGQAEALKAAESCEDLFISGGAGTGKSHLIRAIQRSKEAQGKSVAVCACTGIAADNIGGVTVHRLFEFEIGPLIEQSMDPPDAFQAIDTVIIDEISMLRCDIFEAVRRTIEKAEKKWKKKIQLIVVGDFCQLPPILTDLRGERSVLAHHYGTDDLGKLYAFQSPRWKFRFFELTEVMRQDDAGFSSALNRIRKGDSLGLSWIDEHSAHYPIDGAPVAVASNKAAQEINRKHLKSLNRSTEHTYKLYRSGSVNRDDIKPYEEEVTVRDGALVMILKNDDPWSRRYVNGSIAKVMSSTEDEVTVVILQTGEIINIGVTDNYVYEYRVDSSGKLERNQVGFYKQIPVKLCYAMTIHKMQGLTFDALNLKPATWEYGLLYTALSRVKSVGNLYYEGRLSGLPIECNADVKSFYADPENYKYAWPTSEDRKKRIYCTDGLANDPESKAV